MVDIQDISRLRGETGHSITKCKEALEESGGDMHAARDALREKGALAAEKKSDRDLGAGVVQSYIHNNNQIGALVELLCETDFVARNDSFTKLAQDIAMHCAAFQPRYVSKEQVPEDVLTAMRGELQGEGDALEEKLNANLQKASLLEQLFVLDDSRTVRSVIDESVQKFGERIEVGRFVVWCI